MTTVPAGSYKSRRASNLLSMYCTVQKSMRDDANFGWEPLCKNSVEIFLKTCFKVSFCADITNLRCGFDFFTSGHGRGRFRSGTTKSQWQDQLHFMHWLWSSMSISVGGSYTSYLDVLLAASTVVYTPRVKYFITYSDPWSTRQSSANRWPALQPWCRCRWCCTDRGRA